MGHPYILVVDDDASIRQLVLAVLGDMDYPVRSAQDGRAALQLAGEETPALVLLDMRMPIMDGWEFSRRLREDVGDVPVIVMTAARDAADWAREVNAKGYVAKPFELDDLIRAVEGALPQSA